MAKVLHVMPHPGGGGETYIDLLESLPGYSQERFPLSATRGRGRGVSSVLGRRRELELAAAAADLLHFHGDMAAMLAAPRLAARTPAVITGHGLHRLRRSHGALGWAVRRRLGAAVGAARRAILNSEAERAELAAALPAALHERLVVVPNGVPVAPAVEPARRAELRRGLGLGAEVAVLFAARLEQRKDPLGAIAATEAARARGADLVLLIAGEGPLAAEVRARAGAGVRALGHRDDVADLYDAADLFLLPSHREGMSLALLEAMAHGLAPVVADGAGNAETVADAGRVFAAGDRGAMATALAELAADAGERARLGAAARARLEGELSVGRFRERTAAIYAAVLAEAGGDRGGPTE